MTNKKSTKKALFMSAMSLLLCFSMLIGTTFAWFTDSVSSTNNIIKAGNLDVELYWSKNAKDWEKVTKDTNVFEKNTLWEPGHTEVVYLKVVNEGTLALKYNLGVNIFSETVAINVDGNPFKLSDYIMYSVVDNGTAYANRDAARAAAEAKGATKLNTPYSKASQLLKKGEEAVVTMVVYMPESVGNEANYKTGTNAPVINLGIDLFATQYTKEQDSFGPDYDKDAAWTGAADTSWYKDGVSTFTLDTAEKLAGLAKLVNAGNSFEGKTIELNADMDLNNINWTPIGTKAAPFKGTFKGNNHTISNLTSIGTKSVGLIGATWVGAHIENVKVVNAYVSGEDYVGVIVGGGYLAKNCIIGCVVENATVIAAPFFDNAKGVYDGGAKAGGIIGQAYNGSLKGNTVKNATIMAYRDLGGIAGMLAADGGAAVEASGNTIENVTLSYLGVAGKYDDGETPNQFMGDIVGRVGNKASVADDNKGEATKNEANKGAIMIFTLNELIDFAKAVNAGDTYAGKTVVLGADIDLANMEWTPIGTGNGFKGIFDGNGHTISNLKITGNKSTVGLFANTSNGEIKNLTINNASVSGRLNVGVVAGNPYTSKYTNITVKGHVEVNGFAYVGGVGGKNAYANWTDITVDVDETSYVKAISTENGTAYRTYVGGVVGFNGEGGHTFKNITTNIDVIGDVCDIGGAFGIGHYNNKFENVTVTGNVTSTGEADEIGGILGVWHNQNNTSVTLTNCKFTGKITAADGEVTGCDLVGGKYSSTGTGVLIVDGKDADGNWAVTDVASLQNALTKGGSVKLYADVKAAETMTVAEGATVAIDLNGKTITGTMHKNDGAVLKNEGILTITGGVIKSTAANGGSAIANNGTLIVDGTTLNGAPNANGSWPSYTVNNTGEMTVNNAKITSYHGAVASYNEGALVTLNNCEIDMKGIPGFTNHGIYTYNNGAVVVNGGTYVNHAADQNSTGGSVINGAVTVNGGTFSGRIENYYGTPVIKGGTFSVDPTARLATGYKATKTGDVYMVTAESTDVVDDVDKLLGALTSGKDVVLTEDVLVSSSEAGSNGYGAAGISILNGQTLDGNGNALGVNKWGTWDSAINTTGGIIKNLTVDNGMRGIFISHNSTYAAKVILENVVIDGTIYTISCDQGTGNGLEATNCVFNGWTSYAATLGNVKFVDCSFGEGQGYNFSRPYAPTEYVGCDFAEGHKIDARAAVTFENCTINGQPLTAENLATLVTGGIANATVK